MIENETISMNERSKMPPRKMVTASKDLMIISVASILTSLLVYVFGVFEVFQEWARRQPQWTDWHIHDYLFVLVILSLALGVFSLRRWIELRREIAEHRRVEDALRESEERFRSVASSAIDAIIVADSTGNINFWNQAAETIFGYKEGEALGKPLTLLMPERVRDSHRRGFERFLSTGEAHVIGKTVELAGRKKDGSEFPLEVSLASWKTGEETSFTGIIRDVTERKQAEEALRESEERFVAFMNNSPVVAWLKDTTTWTFSYINNAFEEVFDITRETISKKTDFDLWPEEIARQLRENDLRVMSSDKAIQTSEDVPLPDGTVHHWLVFKFPLHTPSGKSFLAGTAVDITERKQAEEALRQAEEKYRHIFENAIIGIFQTTPEGQYLTANPALARILRYESPEELVATVTDLNRQFYVDRGRREEFLRMAHERALVLRFESQVYCKDGSVIWVSENARAIRDAGGTLIGFEGTTVDITERKNAQDALRQAEEKYRAIFQEAILGIFQTTPDGRYLSVNPAMAHMYGYDSPEELMASRNDIGQQVYVDPNRREEFKRLMEEQGVVEKFEYQVYRKDGSKAWWSENARAVRDNTGTILFYVGTVEDITTRKLAEDERTILIQELRDAMGKVRMLSGLLPICASCKKIRDDEGQWQVLEGYIHLHSEAKFSHGICPECAKRLYPDYYKK